jgi:pimeloyl-ACP methyl ester carboxylesterase
VLTTGSQSELPGVTHAFVALSTGLRMHVAEAGNPDAPTVLLLHGLPQHWWEWRKVIPPLAERYRVVAPDLRGADWTDAPPDGYTVGDVLADVLPLLDTLALRRVGLVAWTSVRSLGSGSASTTRSVSRPFCASARTPTCVSSRTCSPVSRMWFQPVVATPGLGPWALRTDRFARHLLAGSTTTPDSITDEDLAVFTGRLHARGHPEAGSALYRNLIPEMGRFLASTRTASGGSPSRPSRSLAAPMPASGRACSTSTAAKRRPRWPHHRRRGTLPRR